jgi:hypothetical protein
MELRRIIRVADARLKQRITEFHRRQMQEINRMRETLTVRTRLAKAVS